jgi:hypothetical protein
MFCYWAEVAPSRMVRDRLLLLWPVVSEAWALVVAGSVYVL